MSDRPQQLYGVAVAVALDWDGPLAGALILGRSGSGKSALALSLIDTCPWRRTALVADDVVIARRRGDLVIATAPERIAGLIEIRGFGPTRVRAVRETRLLAVIDLNLPPERLPEPKSMAIGEHARLPLWSFHRDGDAPSRLRAIVRSVLGGQMKQHAHHSESIWL